MLVPCVYSIHNDVIDAKYSLCRWNLCYNIHVYAVV